MWSGLDSLLGNAQTEEDLYKILGCTENSTTEQIIAEYRVRALKIHPDKNVGNEAAVAEFQKLQEARDILADVEKRKDYDSWKKCGISITFQQWKNLNSRCHMTMHWATPKREAMVEGVPNSEKEQNIHNINNTQQSCKGEIGDIQWGKTCGQSWESDNRQGVYNEFRNYKI